MAKKKSEALQYMQMPLPSGQSQKRITRVQWNGLNKTRTMNTGALSMEKNISMDKAPCITPSAKRTVYSNAIYETPISMFGFDDFLVVIYRVDDQIKIDYINKDRDIFTGIIKEANATKVDEKPRSIVQFNVFDTTTGDTIVDQMYVKKLLIFPDKRTMDFHIDDDFETAGMECSANVYFNDEEPYLPPETANHNQYYYNSYTKDVYFWYTKEEDDEQESGWYIASLPSLPNMDYVTVNHSRLFGVDSSKVFASGYNDYANWNLDTIDDSNSSNAWCSATQSNSKASGDFTGIVTYQGMVICFKKDFMHEVYNNKNPFRLNDVFAEGAIDNRSIQDVDGRLFFVSEDNVKVYTGANPRIVGEELNIKEYRTAVAGTDNRHYYLFTETDESDYNFFVYDTYTGYWSEESIDVEVKSFAHNSNGMFMLCSDGYIYRIDTNAYGHEWCFETDLITQNTVDIKHIAKLQMLADIAEEAYIKVYILYDDEDFNEEVSQLVYSSTGSGRKAIRVKPRKTANYGFKLRCEGYGYVELHGMEISVESGGELDVTNSGY